MSRALAFAGGVENLTELASVQTPASVWLPYKEASSRSGKVYIFHLSCRSEFRATYLWHEINSFQQSDFCKAVQVLQSPSKAERM